MTIALTMGDPSGIGPEITAGAWRALRATGPGFVALADAGQLGAYAPIRVVSGVDASGFADAMPVLPITLAAAATPGTPSPANAAANIDR